MSRPENLVSILEAGLNANSLRQRVIANNIANVNTAGFKRQAVEFEKILANQLDSGRVNLAEIETEITKPELTPVKANGNNVEMEFEVGQLMKSSGRNKAYIRMLHKRYSQLETAMKV